MLIDLQQAQNDCNNDISLDISEMNSEFHLLFS